MTDLAQQISEFLGRRKAIVAEIINRGGEQEAALLNAYGAPSSVDAMVSGAQQGVMHGFADDMERAERGDGVARKHVLARAARPIEYEVSTLLGTMLAAGGLRFGLEAAGRQASAGARAGSRVSGAAGGAQIAARNAERADRIRQKFTTLGMKPQHRGTVMDAAHGAAWGYGGSDVRANEEAGLNPERLLRATLGAAGSAVAAPVTSSAAVAASNLPLAFGGRRAFSKPMLEPPGVTRANPAGRPRDSIEIARTRDESAARGAGGPGLIARDMDAPINSNFPHVQKLADQAIAPVAPERIAALRAQERNAAANSMVAAYPDPAAARRAAMVARQPARPVPARTPGAEDLARERAARGERPDPMANMREAQLLREAAIREAREAAQPQQGQLNLPEPVDEADAFVRQMMEGFVRQDRPALESWVATLEAAHRNDSSIMPRVRAAVARQLAINERADPALNNTPHMKEFLHALGLWGNKAKGTPNILEAARAPAREQFPTGRYEAALARTADDTPMRPRHAERMRQEMDAFQPGPYTGPADARRGPPLVARGDDQPYWLNPIDFFREGKVNDGEVNMAGLLSGPASYLIEDKLVGPAAQFLIGSPEHVEQPGALADVRPEQAAALVPEEVIPPRQQAPAMTRQAPARPAPMTPAVPTAPAAPAPPRAPDAAQRPERDVIMDIQQVMIDAGIPVGGPDGLPDGIVGRKTRRAIELFTQGANRSLEDVLERIRSYPRGRLAQILSQ